MGYSCGYDGDFQPRNGTLPMIIGVSGLAGSGKDAVAEILCRNFPVCRIALADEIKRIIGRLYGFSVESRWGPSHLRQEESPWFKGLTCRRAAQVIGTETARHAHPDTWGRFCLRDVWDILQGSGYDPAVGLIGTGDYQAVVIPDVRFLNEVEVLRKAGAHLWKVVRPGAGLTGEAGEHSSEHMSRTTPDSFFDRVIENDSTLEALETKVIRAYLDVKGEYETTD